MHVEISVALNFVISYLYNKLPRRRVDLLVEELETGLKQKFEGHWYPDKPSKGSGYRCIKVNGEEVDPVIMQAATNAGLDLEEVRACLPDDLTIWIDPSEVSYKLGEKCPVKILFSDVKEEESVPDKTDKEVQAASHTFNPDAQSFNPDAQTFNPEAQSFNPSSSDSLLYNPCAEMHAYYTTDPSQSFQPIDSLSSSLSNLSLSPSSPVPSQGAWSTATSPSSTLLNSASPTAGLSATGYLSPRQGGGGNVQVKPQFTAAMFAQTKFGSTKLKTNAKRPNRLSPTEFGNFFRQQQRTYAGPARPRSLSPRDPRVEFLLDQQQRYIQQQQQQCQRQQMSPSMAFPPQFPIHPQHPPHLAQSSMLPEFVRQHSAGISSSHSSPHISPHLSPHLSPQSAGTSFQDLIPRSNSIHNPGASSSSFANYTTTPSPHGLGTHNLVSPSPNPGANGLHRPSSLSHLGRTGLPPSSRLAGYTNSVHQNGTSSSPVSHHGSMAQMKTLSPDAPKSFVDGLNSAPVNYPNNLHLLMAN